MSILNLSAVMKHKSIITLFCLFGFQVQAFDEIEVTPLSPKGWAATNVREDGLVEINPSQPLFGDGSLLFATDTQTNGQDKADFELLWQQSEDSIDFPSRTLGAISSLSYAWYRDGSSTTTAHFIPVLRINFYDDGGTPGAANFADDVAGILIWEGVYNGFNNPVNDSWELVDVLDQNFWAFVSFNPSGNTGVIQNFSAKLADWRNGNVVGQNGDPVISLSNNSYITGVNVGVGSGWGNTFIGYVDAIRIAFGQADDRLFNFEVCGIFVPNDNPDVIFDDSFECFKRI